LRSDKQRHLINNFKLATQLGAEVIKVQNTHITDAILEVVAQTNHHRLHWETAFEFI
jgi:two-component system sensor histidine kinase KdpD